MALADTGGEVPLGHDVPGIDQRQHGDEQRILITAPVAPGPPSVIALMTPPASTGVATPMAEEMTTRTRNAAMKPVVRSGEAQHPQGGLRADGTPGQLVALAGGSHRAPARHHRVTHAVTSSTDLHRYAATDGRACP